MSGRLIRLIAAVGVAGLLALIAAFALRFGWNSGRLVIPWELIPFSCITWLILANVIGRRGPVATTLLGILSVVMTAAIKILVRFGIGWASAKEGATVSQIIEALSLMMTMQLAETVLFSGWATVPAGVITAFLVRRIMKTSAKSEVRG